MSTLGTYVSNLVRSALYTIHPNKVDQYTYEQYVTKYYLCEKVSTLYSTFFFYQIANHYDMIYVPKPALLDTPSRDMKAYSLFRFQGDVQMGLKFFKHYAEVINVLAAIRIDETGKVEHAWLESVTGLCRRYEDWNAAHIAASLNFLPAFKNKLICSLVNVPDMESGATPLFVAVKAGHLEMVRLLVGLINIDLTILDSKQNSLLHAATQPSSPDILKVILDMSSSANGDICEGDKSNRILNMDAANANGETPIYLACHSKRRKIVEALLLAGASPIAGSSDLYPLHLAVEQDSIELVELLCKHCPGGINVQTRSKKLSAIHFAKNKPMFNKLLDFGIDLNLCDNKGRTILHKIVQERNLADVVTLLVHGSDATAPDHAGITPLHLAVEKAQNVYIIYALIAFEADVNSLDKSGASARHWLCQHESEVYQRSSIRDTVLYALDAVNATRCPPGMANCTEGCISPISVESSASSKLAPSTSLNFFLQLIQDMASSSPPTCDSAAVLFNGTPPAPLLDVEKLKDDLDHDLFSCTTDNLNSLKRRSKKTKVDEKNHAPHEPSPVLASQVGEESSSVVEIDKKHELLSSQLGESFDTHRPDTDGMKRHYSSSYIDQLKLPKKPEETGLPIRSTLSKSVRFHPRSYSFGEPCIEETVEEASKPGENKADEPTKPTTLTFTQSFISRLMSLTSYGVMDADATTHTSESSTAASPNTSAASSKKDESEVIPQWDVGGDLITHESPYEAENSPSLSPSCNHSADQEKLSAASEPPSPTSNGQPSTTQGQTPVRDWMKDPLRCTDDFFGPAVKGIKFQWTRNFPNCNAVPGIPCCQARYSRCISGQRIPGDSEPSASFKTHPFLTDSDGYSVGPNGYRILSLDGGGIRGIVLCQALRALERTAGRPIRDLYDWIIGTSTGAMLALNLAQGKCVRYNRCLYFRMKDTLFIGSRPYSTKILEDCLKDEFGSKSVMSSLSPLRVTVTSLRGDQFPPKLYMFRNYLAPWEQMEKLVNELVAARSNPSSKLPDEKSREKPATSSKDGENNGARTPPRDIQNRRMSPNQGISVADPKSGRQGQKCTGSKSINPLMRDLPFSQLLDPFINELFGETIRKTKEIDKEDLHDSILSLLSSFVRRYVYNSKIFTHTNMHNQLVWHAARASGAAPFYFRAFGPFLDGGIISNNPTLDILTEIHESNLICRLRGEPLIPISCITSVGTGRTSIREVRQLDVFRPQSLSEAYQAAMGFTELTRIIIDVACMSDGRVVERSRAWCSSTSVPFFRINPYLSNDIGLDESDTQIVLQMMWECDAYLCSIPERLHRLANQLIGDSN